MTVLLTGLKRDLNWKALFLQSAIKSAPGTQDYAQEFRSLRRFMFGNTVRFPGSITLVINDLGNK